MMTLADIQERLELLDMQIINLLQERSRICTDAGNQGGLDGDQESEILSLWMEEAAERGLDESKMEKMAKLVIGLCRVAEESE
jgi:chorismate mutase